MHNNNLNSVRTHFASYLSNTYNSNAIGQLFTQLTTHITALNKTQQLTNVDYRITESEINTYNNAIQRLLQYEPLQYIIGYEFFYDLKFNVNSHTLIPRPETEELVKLIVNNHSFNNKKLTIIDIGTGSGCIGIALKKNMPNASVTLCDISEEAINTAQQNASNNDCEVTCEVIDVLNYNKYQWQKYDIVVSNPPYVMQQEQALMQANVVNYEPHTALFVPNNNPLLFYNAIGNLAMQHLTSKGMLYVEINENLGNETAALLTTIGFKNVTIINDINNKSRIISASKH
jgi:release factor glutamine methyltransferase